MRRISIFEENRRLKEELKFKDRKIAVLEERCAALERELKEVKALLNQLLNANTPSSKLPPSFKPFNREPKGTNPRGKPQGSNGATRDEPEKIDRTVEVKSNHCPNGHRKIKETGCNIRFAYDIVMRLEAIQFNVHGYECMKCGANFEATHPELPKEGIFCPKLQSFLTELRHSFAGSYEKMSLFLYSLTGSTFSAQGMKDCIHRVADKLKPSYKKMEEEMGKADVVNSDETSWPVDGKGYWLWLLCTLNFVFITIKESRGRKVITDVLGGFFNGVIGSDCLKVYNGFAAAFQRCWSHLLRRSHFEKEKYKKRDIVKLHEQLTNLYKDAKGFLDEKPAFEERVWNGIMYQQKLQRITDHRWRSQSAKKIANMLKATRGQWFVGVFMPEVDLTNNKDERGIRKVIPTRKLLGGHRTDHGAYDFAVIESHRQTWRLRGQSPFQLLADYLKKSNVTQVS